MSTMQLSAEDRTHLADLEQHLQLVRDRTSGVATGYATGFFLHGEGGVGKSYTVLQELERLKANYKIFNSRMTGRGLYNALEKFPDAVHVLEDMEQLAHDRGAQGVLRSALWGQRRSEHGPQERLVTWTTHRMEHSFYFTGGIIMISNRPLADLPELRAVRTRISCLQFQPSEQQLRALMRRISLDGYAHEDAWLAPEQCSDVCEYVIAASIAMRRQLDMRALVSSFRDYLQWEDGSAGCHWHDLVTARLQERVIAFQREVTVGGRAFRKAQEQAIAREVANATSDRDERLRLWRERTGKSEQSLYRRLQEAEPARSA